MPDKPPNLMFTKSHHFKSESGYHSHRKKILSASESFNQKEAIHFFWLLAYASPTIFNPKKNFLKDVLDKKWDCDANLRQMIQQYQRALPVSLTTGDYLYDPILKKEFCNRNFLLRCMMTFIDEKIDLSNKMFFVAQNALKAETTLHEEEVKKHKEKEEGIEEELKMLKILQDLALSHQELIAYYKQIMINELLNQAIYHATQVEHHDKLINEQKEALEQLRERIEEIDKKLIPEQGKSILVKNMDILRKVGAEINLQNPTEEEREKMDAFTQLVQAIPRENKRALEEQEARIKENPKLDPFEMYKKSVALREEMDTSKPKVPPVLPKEAHEKSATIELKPAKDLAEQLGERPKEKLPSEPAMPAHGKDYHYEPLVRKELLGDIRATEKLRGWMMKGKKPRTIEDLDKMYKEKKEEYLQSEHGATETAPAPATRQWKQKKHKIETMDDIKSMYKATNQLLQGIKDSEKEVSQLMDEKEQLEGKVQKGQDDLKGLVAKREEHAKNHEKVKATLQEEHKISLSNPSEIKAITKTTSSQSELNKQFQHNIADVEEMDVDEKSAQIQQMSVKEEQILKPRKQVRFSEHTKQ